MLDKELARGPHRAIEHTSRGLIQRATKAFLLLLGCVAFQVLPNLRQHQRIGMLMLGLYHLCKLDDVCSFFQPYQMSAYLVDDSNPD